MSTYDDCRHVDLDEATARLGIGVDEVATAQELNRSTRSRRRRDRVDLASVRPDTPPISVELFLADLAVLSDF